MAALSVSLVLSAFLTAVALRLPDQHWLAWISFLPLFVVVRWLRFSAAALAGAFWGGCLYVFATAGVAHEVGGRVLTIGPSAWLLALLIVIPAVYVGLAARPARAIGFKLLTLALGWTLLEVVLAVAYAHTPIHANAIGPANLRGHASLPAHVAQPPSAVARSHATPRKLKHAAQNGSPQRVPEPRASFSPEPRASARAALQVQHTPSTLLSHGSPHQGVLPVSQAEGLLGNAQGNGLQYHWLARLLGYIGSAFLVACINASLVGILSGARWSFPHRLAWGVSPNVIRWRPSRENPPIQTWPLCQAHPRAPPVQLAPVN